MISDCLASIERAYASTRILPTEFLDGVEHLSENASPPRIVWGNVAEHVVAPDPHWTSDERCLHLREVTVDAHLWAEDRDQVEAMLPVLVWAVRKVVGAAYRLTHLSWPQGSERLVQKGIVALLPITFFIPLNVPDGVEGEATISSTDTTDTALPFGNPPPFGE
jgi:hypothetical protein